MQLPVQPIQWATYSSFWRLDSNANDLLARQVTKLSSVTAFFPCCNDAGTIGGVVLRALETLPKVAHDYEVVVIDDGSHDESKSVLDNLAAKFPQVRVVHRAKPSGYGGVLRAGFAEARKEWIFYTDGDGQYDPGELILLVEGLRDGVGVVNGYRTKRCDPFHRVVLGRAYNAFVRSTFGLIIRDIDCDFRLVRRQILNQISLESNNATITIEMISKIQNAGYPIAEVHVRHWPRRYGRSQFFNLPQVIETLVALIRWGWILVIRGAALANATENRQWAVSSDE